MINDSVEKEIGSLAWPGYSPPGLGFRTPEDWSGSVSRPKKRTHPTRLRRSPPRGGVGDRGWVGGGVGGIQPVPIVATVQLHLSQQRRDYFYKASDSVPRQYSRLKTSLESTLRAERKTVFYLVTLLQRLHSSFSPGAQPYGLTSAKCVLKRPIFTPPLHSPLPHRPHCQHLLSPSSPSSLVVSLFAHLLAGWHCYHYTGRIYGVRAYGKNKKASVNTCGKHCVNPPPHLLLLVLTASLGMHLSDT